jgi:hypothetical protein
MCTVEKLRCRPLQVPAQRSAMGELPLLGPQGVRIFALPFFAEEYEPLRD